MEYLKLFNTENDYLTYRDGSDYLKPNVSLCDGNSMVYYNYPPPIVYEAVDLGLPNGTLWATMNVGASKPSDAGLYFQWGDTQGYTKDQIGEGDGKKPFSWSDYKFSIDGSSSNFNKYKQAGDALDLADDAANANMGGDWHIPTPSQIQELIDNTTSDWIKMDNVNGRLFTSKKNGKSIFIPAAGYAWNGSLGSSGGYGGVWSAMLSTGGVYYGKYLRLSSVDARLDGNYRCDGFSVRGVLG